MEIPRYWSELLDKTKQIPNNRFRFVSNGSHFSRYMSVVIVQAPSIDWSVIPRNSFHLDKKRVRIKTTKTSGSRFPRLAISFPQQAVLAGKLKGSLTENVFESRSVGCITRENLATHPKEAFYFTTLRLFIFGPLSLYLGRQLGIFHVQSFSLANRRNFHLPFPPCGGCS